MIDPQDRLSLGAIDYFKALQKNEPIVPKQTSYARVLSGEIAILLDYDFNAYRAKYKDQANVQFVIPAEGTLVVPYVMSLVANAPHADNGRKVLDFVLSDEGQAFTIKDQGNLTSLKSPPFLPNGFDPKVAKIWAPEFAQFSTLRDKWLEEWNTVYGYRQ